MTTRLVIRIIHSAIRGSEEGGVGVGGGFEGNKYWKAGHLLSRRGSGIEVFGASVLCARPCCPYDGSAAWLEDCWSVRSLTHVPTAHIHLLSCGDTRIVFKEIGAYGPLWTFKEGVEKRDI
jgi:hypothetical protein